MSDGASVSGGSGEATSSPGTSGPVTAPTDANTRTSVSLGRDELSQQQKPPQHQQQPSARRSVQPTNGTFVPFQKGRTRLNAGVLHLYRDRSEVAGIAPDTTIRLGGTDTKKERRGDNGELEADEEEDEEVTREEAQEMKGSGTMLAVLAVPAYMTSQDFLNFIGPA
ncbi:hypothetical protein HK405_000698, partial [Cladochytrium tenue]